MNPALFKLLTLDGGKTYIAGILFIVFGLYQLANDQAAEGQEKLLQGLAIIGIGRKLEKMKG